MAWEIRMYSLGTALAMLSSWLLLRALSARPPRGLPWMLYMLVALLFAYTHYCALFSLFAQALFALGYLLYGVRRDVMAALKDVRFRWFVLAYTGMAAGWSAWLPVFSGATAAGGRRLESNVPFSPQDVPAICYEMCFYSEVHDSALSYAVIVTAVSGSVLLVMLWKGGAGQWCVACLAVVPFTVISAVSTLGSSLMIVRYMAFLQPFLLIAVAAALWRIPCDWLRDLMAYGGSRRDCCLRGLRRFARYCQPPGHGRGGLYRRQSPSPANPSSPARPCCCFLRSSIRETGRDGMFARPAAASALHGRTGYNCRGRLLPPRRGRRSHRAGVGDYQLGQVGRLGNVPSAIVGEDGGAAISRSVRVPKRRGCDMLPDTITKIVMQNEAIDSSAPAIRPNSAAAPPPILGMNKCLPCCGATA